MPAPINTNVPSASKPVDKTHSRSHAKKTRVIRRRGRGKGSLDSDEEIEREVMSDTDTDGQSSLASDSETDSGSDDEAQGGIVTPSTTQSPPPLDIGGPSTSLKPTGLVNGSAGPFVNTTDWAQIVADDDGAADADLPVIDFADMHAHVIPEPVTTQPKAPSPRPRKQKQSKHEQKVSAARAPPEPSAAAAKAQTEEAPAKTADEAEASTSKSTHQDSDGPRSRGQSARQVYQQRLQDPAFVPRVGDFWGHDDRLLDKDLRSLSGWWRGRWHRGRGRGGFALRGRGGHAFVNGMSSHADKEQGGNGAVAAEDVPPVERAWTHDGFEEMKRKEEARRERRLQEQEQSRSHPVDAQRGGRGRGGFFGGRGRGFARGGGVAATAATNGSSNTTTSSTSQDPSTQRVWFAMKPEKVWTKHTDNFLYFEPVLRGRPGQTAGIRVNLPGHTSQVVRSRRDSQAIASALAHDKQTRPSTSASEEPERQFIVRMPKPVPKPEPVPQQPQQETAELATTVAELSIEEVFTVRPYAVPNHVPLTQSVQADQRPAEPTTEPASSALLAAQDGSAKPPSIVEESQQVAEPVEPQVQTTPAQPQGPESYTFSSNSEVIAPVPIAPVAVDQSRPPLAALPPLQTTFSPVPQASPQYGSPYGYPTALPPGIALNPQGYAYDVATGQPVYIQTPPPAMYTPRPMMHGYMPPFVPGHMHHPSQEFVPQQVQTPPIGGFIDPATGVPIFAPARQSSRIEIRAPTDRFEGKAGKGTGRPSGLRNGTSGEQHQPLEQGEGSDSASANASSGQDQAEHQMQHQMQPQGTMPVMDPSMMAYAPYQQQYYYTDPNGYPAYMDMSQQMMPYEMYPAPPPDQRNSQPVIYY